MSGEEVDRYNNPVISHSTTEDVPASFAWNSTQEETIDRELRTSVATLVVGPEVSLTAADRIVFEGTTYQVDGRPQEVWTHHGLHHWVVPLKVYEG